MQQTSPLLIKRKKKLLKSPLEILWIDTTYDGQRQMEEEDNIIVKWAQEDVEKSYNLLNK